MHDQIEAADFVLVICSETYERRALNHETPGRGRGATWEGAILTQEAYAEDAARLIPITMSDEAMGYIPYFLRGTTVYRIDLTSQAGIEQLLRHILGLPAIVPPPVGVRPVLRARQPADPRKWPPKNSADPGADNATPGGESPANDLDVLRKLIKEIYAITTKQAPLDVQLLGIRTICKLFRDHLESALGVDVRVAVLEVFVDDEAAFMTRRILSEGQDSDLRGSERKAKRVDDSVDLTEVLRSGQPWISGDIADLHNAYRNNNMRDRSLYRSVLVVPIRMESNRPPASYEMYGFLTMDSKEVGAFDAPLALQWATLAADLLAFALRSVTQLDNV